MILRTFLFARMRSRNTQRIGATAANHPLPCVHLPSNLVTLIFRGRMNSAISRKLYLTVRDRPVTMNVRCAIRWAKVYAKRYMSGARFQCHDGTVGPLLYRSTRLLLDCSDKVRLNVQRSAMLCSYGSKGAEKEEPVLSPEGTESNGQLPHASRRGNGRCRAEGLGSHLQRLDEEESEPRVEKYSTCFKI